MGPMQIVAIDWSGERGGGKKDIAVAQASHGRLDEILTGLNRTAVGDWLIAKKHELEEDYGETLLLTGKSTSVRSQIGAPTWLATGGWTRRGSNRRPKPSTPLMPRFQLSS